MAGFVVVVGPEIGVVGSDPIQRFEIRLSRTEDDYTMLVEPGVLALDSLGNRLFTFIVPDEKIAPLPPGEYVSKLITFDGREALGTLPVQIKRPRITSLNLNLHPGYTEYEDPSGTVFSEIIFTGEYLTDVHTIQILPWYSIPTFEPNNPTGNPEDSVTTIATGSEIIVDSDTQIRILLNTPMRQKFDALKLGSWKYRLLSTEDDMTDLTSGSLGAEFPSIPNIQNYVQTPTPLINGNTGNIKITGTRLGDVGTVDRIEIGGVQWIPTVLTPTEISGPVPPAQYPGVGNHDIVLMVNSGPRDYPPQVDFANEYYDVTLPGAFRVT